MQYNHSSVCLGQNLQNTSIMFLKCNMQYKWKTIQKWLLLFKFLNYTLINQMLILNMLLRHPNFLCTIKLDFINYLSELDLLSKFSKQCFDILLYFCEKIHLKWTAYWFMSARSPSQYWNSPTYNGSPLRGTNPLLFVNLAILNRYKIIREFSVRYLGLGGWWQCHLSKGLGNPICSRETQVLIPKGGRW